MFLINIRLSKCVINAIRLKKCVIKLLKNVFLHFFKFLIDIKLKKCVTKLFLKILFQYDTFTKKMIKTHFAAFYADEMSHLILMEWVFLI